jgi:hypothetical protein
MVRIVSLAKTLLVAGALAVSSLGFAGVATAEPACSGSVPSGSAHQPFPSGRGPSSSANCEDALDSSKTSMTDIAAAGSYKAAAGSYNNGSAVFSYDPQGTT